jgi:hypothetical protein
MLPRSCPLLLAVILISLLQSPAVFGQAGVPGQAPAAPARQLTLIPANDPEFETLLNTNFPGLESLDGYAVFRPYLAFLRNDTSRPARAYQMLWARQSASLQRLQPINAFIYRYDPAPAVGRIALAVGELRLVSPSFDVSPKEFQLAHQHNWVVRQLSARQTHPPYSLADTQSVTPSVDAVFDDGLCTGVNRHNLFESYQQEVNAERDMAEALLRLLDAKASEAEVSAFLSSERNAATAANTSQSGSAALYASHRLQHALNYQALYKDGGMENVMTRAWTVTQHRQQQVCSARAQ